MTDKKFCHFWQFFALWAPDNPENQNFKIEKNTWRYYHFKHLHHKWQSYDVWFTEFLSFWTVFCPFYPHNNPKNQNFEKLKKTPPDITIFHMCTINDNHMIYGFWDIKHNRFFCHLDHFLRFYPPNNPKNQNFEKMKKTPGDTIILHMCTKN